MELFEEDVVSQRLGNRFKGIHIDKGKHSDNLMVYTGVSDLMDDEIVLTILPEKGILSDLGYTDYSLECLSLDFDFNHANQLIQSHDVQLFNEYQQILAIPYGNNEKELIQQVKKLTSCIVDMYAIAYFK